MSNYQDEFKYVTCRNCGEDQCFWDTNKKGKRYLAIYAEWEGSYGGKKSIKVWHQCCPVRAEIYQEYLAAKAIEVAAAVVKGEIVKGQTIEVVKGRKVAIGTVGIVFWVSPKKDRFDVINVGFTTTAGDKHFINIDNVQVAECLDDAHELEVLDGKNVFAGNNDVTISGMSDTTLMSTLDGKAY
jgi:hypothetical protein